MTKTADELRAEAAERDRSAQESFERCDTDGFVTQWASSLTARMKRMEADLLDDGGTARFRGLFNEDGQRVKAKRVTGSDYFGNPETKWIVLDEDDSVLHWVNIPKTPETPSARSKMGKLGLHEEWEQAKAKVEMKGSGTGLSGLATCHPGFTRIDGGFPEGAIVWEGK